MAFQFLHIDTVARTVPKKATAKRWSLRDVLAEAGREAAACPHVEAPRAPKRLFGLPLPLVERATLHQADEARDATGRKLRKDAPVMLAGVISYPVALADMDERAHTECAAWESRSLLWLTGRFGDTLGAVVRHEDETYPHLHFFIVPHLAAGQRLDFEAVHPGIAAREAAKRAGKTGKEANRAYCEAMRTLQDDFHEHVGVFHGHLREGPRRRRLSRGAYLAVQREAEKRSEAMKKAEFEREQFKLIAEAGKKAAQRAARLEIELGTVRAENANLSGEVRLFKGQVAGLKVTVEGHRKEGREAARIIVYLIGAFTIRARRCREGLLNMSRPEYVPESAWETMRRFLMNGDGIERRRGRQKGWERE